MSLMMRLRYDWCCECDIGSVEKDNVWIVEKEYGFTYNRRREVVGYVVEGLECWRFSIQRIAIWPI